MSLDINNTSLVYNSGSCEIRYGGNAVKTIASDGNLRNYTAGTPMFFVGGSSAAWASLPGANWNIIILDTATYNYQSCYNTSNGRFTVPVTGLYLFTASTYNYHTNGSHYFHPVLGVNNNTAARRPGGTPYRVRGHYITASHAVDCDVCEIMYLYAGDYVNYYQYADADGGYWYPVYSHFAGILLG